ncbi:TSUP family transporter [Clostridium sp. CF012]|uniref:TSUP family transporter n=1 Tax=Clostridium sp. CF012 TaxID=2843319 RepID=UPI00209ABEA8|nr:TSUP family transporter [Clostridium sp. CF012]
MIGNAAGPIFSVYLLTMNFKKIDFMGTTAWFFFLINLSKVPLQILFWHNISFKSILLSVDMVPSIAIGAFLGMIMIKKINEKSFRYIIIGMTAIAEIRLLI